jgi:ribosomal protein L29
MVPRPEILKEKSEKQIMERIGDLKHELMKIRFQAAADGSMNSARMRFVRKEIARGFTEIKHRQLAVNMGS